MDELLVRAADQGLVQIGGNDGYVPDEPYGRRGSRRKPPKFSVRLSKPWKKGESVETYFRHLFTEQAVFENRVRKEAPKALPELKAMRSDLEDAWTAWKEGERGTCSINLKRLIENFKLFKAKLQSMGHTVVESVQTLKESFITYGRLARLADEAQKDEAPKATAKNTRLRTANAADKKLKMTCASCVYWDKSTTNCTALAQKVKAEQLCDLYARFIERLTPRRKKRLVGYFDTPVGKLAVVGDPEKRYSLPVQEYVAGSDIRFTMDELRTVYKVKSKDYKIPFEAWVSRHYRVLPESLGEGLIKIVYAQQYGDWWKLTPKAARKFAERLKSTGSADLDDFGKMLKKKPRSVVGSGRSASSGTSRSHVIHPLDYDKDDADDLIDKLDEVITKPGRYSWTETFRKKGRKDTVRVKFEQRTPVEVEISGESPLIKVAERMGIRWSAESPGVLHRARAGAILLHRALKKMGYKAMKTEVEEPGGDEPADTAAAKVLARQMLKQPSTVLSFRQLWRHKYVKKDYDANEAWKLFYWPMSKAGAGGKGFNPNTRVAASKLMAVAFNKWAKAGMKTKVRRADGVKELPIGQISRAEFIKWYSGGGGKSGTSESPEETVVVAPAGFKDMNDYMRQLYNDIERDAPGTLMKLFKRKKPSISYPQYAPIRVRPEASNRNVLPVHWIEDIGEAQAVPVDTTYGGQKPRKGNVKRNESKARRISKDKYARVVLEKMGAVFRVGLRGLLSLGGDYEKLGQALQSEGWTRTGARWAHPQSKVYFLWMDEASGAPVVGISESLSETFVSHGGPPRITPPGKPATIPHRATDIIFPGSALTTRRRRRHPKGADPFASLFVEQEPPKAKEKPKPTTGDAKKAEKEDFDIDDIQLYYDMQIAGGSSQGQAIRLTRKKFKLKTLKINPAGRVMVQGMEKPTPPAALLPAPAAPVGEPPPEEPAPPEAPPEREALAGSVEGYSHWGSDLPPTRTVGGMVGGGNIPSTGPDLWGHKRRYAGSKPSGMSSIDYKGLYKRRKKKYRTRVS